MQFRQFGRHAVIVVFAVVAVVFSARRPGTRAAVGPARGSGTVRRRAGLALHAAIAEARSVVVIVVGAPRSQQQQFILSRLTVGASVLLLQLRLLRLLCLLYLLLLLSLQIVSIAVRLDGTGGAARVDLCGRTTVAREQLLLLLLLLR